MINKKVTLILIGGILGVGMFIFLLFGIVAISRPSTVHGQFDNTGKNNYIVATSTAVATSTKNQLTFGVGTTTVTMFTARGDETSVNLWIDIADDQKVVLNYYVEYSDSATTSVDGAVDWYGQMGKIDDAQSVATSTEYLTQTPFIKSLKLSTSTQPYPFIRGNSASTTLSIKLPPEPVNARWTRYTFYSGGQNIVGNKTYLWAQGIVREPAF